MTKSIYLAQVKDADNDELRVWKNSEYPELTGVGIREFDTKGNYYDASVGLDDTQLLLVYDAIAKRLIERGVFEPTKPAPEVIRTTSA